MNFRKDQWNLFLENDDIEMYSTYNKGKPVVAERFIITLKNKICKLRDFSSKKCIYWQIKWCS